MNNSEQNAYQATTSNTNNVAPPDPRVTLTPEEVEWAQAIKTAVEATPELDNLSDFWYAQIALVDQGNLDVSMERVEHYQNFREEYKITDTYGEAVRYIRQQLLEFPGLYLSFSRSPKGHLALVIDITKLDMSRLKTGDQVDNFLRGSWYIHNMANPDFDGIRHGVIVLTECEGFGWQHVSLNFYKKLWNEIFLHYPMTLRQSKHFHTGVLMNLMASLTRPLMPAEVKQVYQVGGIFDGRLDDMYLQPTLEEATERFLLRVEDALRLRYRIQETFRLPPLNTTNANDPVEDLSENTDMVNEEVPPA